MLRSIRRARPRRNGRARISIRRGVRIRRRSARGDVRLLTLWTVVLVVAGGIGLSACGSSPSLSLPASEHLPPTISGAPGSSSWCEGMKKTANSLVGLGRGESNGIAARIVRNGEHRVESAMRHLPARSPATTGLKDSLTTMRRAVSDLESGGGTGLQVAEQASSQITSALTHLGGSAGPSC